MSRNSNNNNDPYNGKPAVLKLDGVSTYDSADGEEEPPVLTNITLNPGNLYEYSHLKPIEEEPLPEIPTTKSIKTNSQRALGSELYNTPTNIPASSNSLYSQPNPDETVTSESAFAYSRLGTNTNRHPPELYTSLQTLAPNKATSIYSTPNSGGNYNSSVYGDGFGNSFYTLGNSSSDGKSVSPYGSAESVSPYASTNLGSGSLYASIDESASDPREKISQTLSEHFVDQNYTILQSLQQLKSDAETAKNDITTRDLMLAQKRRGSFHFGNSNEHLKQSIIKDQKHLIKIIEVFNKINQNQNALTKNEKESFGMLSESLNSKLVSQQNEKFAGKNRESDKEMAKNWEKISPSANPSSVQALPLASTTRTR